MGTFAQGAAVMLVALAITPRATHADDDLAVIVASNFQEDVNNRLLRALFTCTERRWGNGTAVVALNYPPNHPLRVMFDQAVLDLDPDGVGRYWIDQRIRGGPPPPRHVGSPQLVTRLVARLPGSIGYVPRALVDPSVRVVAWIRAGRLVFDEKEGRR